MKYLSQLFRCIVAGGSLFVAAQAQAQVLGAGFAGNYTVTDLGSVGGLPPAYGGLTFLNNNTLLIGGNANEASGLLYTVSVTRDAGNHVTGFGIPSAFGSVGTFNDGGVAFGPGGVLFTSRWPSNELGQTKPGSTAEDKVINMALLGIAQSHAALNFVPGGFGGAGKIKMVSWEDGQWYSGDLQPDGLGTFDIVNVLQIDLDTSVAGMTNLGGGPEGFVFIEGTNAGFGGINSMLISEYSANTVGAFELDADGNPLAGTRRDFLTGLSGAEGAVIDPMTGDFLFSTFGGGDRVVRVSGFTIPTVVPEPASLPLVVLALAGCGWVARQGRHKQV